MPSFAVSFARFLHHVEEVVDDVLGLAGEFLAQRRVLRRDSDRDVLVALRIMMQAGDERRGGEAEFIGAQQRADDDVAAGLHLAVDLDRDASAQLEHERLLRFGEAELPRRARVLIDDHGDGAAVMARDRDVVGLRFRNRGSTVPTPTSETSEAESTRVFAFFRSWMSCAKSSNRVDVMVRGWRDQLDAGRRITQQRDVFDSCREPPAFAGVSRPVPS